MSIRWFCGLALACMITTSVAAAQTPVAGGKIKVLIVDDHPLMRVGIAAILNATPDMTVVAQAVTITKRYVAYISSWSLQIFEC